MGRRALEKVSQREYARRLGISNEAVRKAVEGGKISKGWDKKEKKIIVEKANEEWGNIHKHVEPDVSEITSRITPYDPDKQESNPAKTPQKIPSYDGDEDTQAGAFAELEEYELALSNKAPFAEALRVEKVAKAKQEVLQLREKTGQLVRKDEVYKQLFAFGQSIRQALLVVPDRCIDEILAAPNRAESHAVLTKYIHEALLKLSEADNMNFQE